MINIKGDATLVGISELRTHSEEILAESKKHKVLIGRRNKPVAVLIDIDRFSKMEETLDLLEDFALGFLAKEREDSSRNSDYMDIKDALKKVKKK